jgi:hypothetical protein
MADRRRWPRPQRNVTTAARPSDLGRWALADGRSDTDDFRLVAIAPVEEVHGQVSSVSRLALGVAVAVGVLLLLVAGAYGFHRDELYFVVAGRHPALGYVDQPPLTPILSAAAVAFSVRRRWRSGSSAVCAA